MPIILLILFDIKLSFKFRIIGIPPATEASYSKFTLFISATDDKKFPCFAINALFAVITCFLFINEDI